MDEKQGYARHADPGGWGPVGVLNLSGPQPLRQLTCRGSCGGMLVCFARHQWGWLRTGQAGAGPWAGRMECHGKLPHNEHQEVCGVCGASWASVTQSSPSSNADTDPESWAGGVTGHTPALESFS